jgi:3-deoxy-D-manno-octulosonic-acid transferase
VNALLRLGYGAAAFGADLVARVIPPPAASGSGAKWHRALAGRRGLTERYREWASVHRDPSRPLLWFHAPSVGEGLQARPILELARAQRRDAQLAYTFFSPSAEPFANSLDVDVAGYLPFDTVSNARALLDALRPQAIVFSKLDVWPTLALESHARGVALVLVSATLAAGSSRRGLMATALLRESYALLDAVGAIDADDAARLVELGVRADRISVTGDTRYDQVAARAGRTNRSSALLAPLASTRPTLVAGSTWPADEAPLLAAFTAVRQAVPTARLIIAPHEPTATHLAPIESWSRRNGLTLARIPVEGAVANADVLLVDRVGVLGELYALADVAFVGGAFHAAGIHSVLEPASFGAPVLFGPRHQASRDAGLLIAAGGGFVVGDADEAAAQLRRLFTDTSARTSAGRAAGEVVARGTGAAGRSWALVASTLAGTSSGSG